MLVCYCHQKHAHCIAFPTNHYMGPSTSKVRIKSVIFVYAETNPKHRSPESHKIRLEISSAYQTQTCLPMPYTYIVLKPWKELLRLVSRFLFPFQFFSLLIAASIVICSTMSSILILTSTAAITYALRLLRTLLPLPLLFLIPFLALLIFLIFIIPATIIITTIIIIIKIIVIIIIVIIIIITQPNKCLLDAQMR